MIILLFTPPKIAGIPSQVQHPKLRVRSCLPVPNTTVRPLSRSNYTLPLSFGQPLVCYEISHCSDIVYEYISSSVVARNMSYILIYTESDLHSFYIYLIRDNQLKSNSQKNRCKNKANAVQRRFSSIVI